MLKLHYQKIGENNEKSMVFLHGFMGSGRESLELARELSKDFDCYLIDLPGHANSAHLIDEYANFEQLVDEINNWAKTLRSPHLFGYSMGGRIAFALANLKLCAFVKVIIESADPGIRAQKEKLDRAAADAKLFKDVNSKDDFARFLDIWYSQALFHEFKSHPNYGNFIQNKLQEQDPQQLQKAINIFGPGMQPNLWEGIKSVRCPGLYLYGEHDSKYKKIAMSLESFGWNTAEIKESGHNTHFQNLEYFKQDFFKFIF